MVDLQQRQHLDEAVAQRILSWMAQIQRDRSLPTSALATAFGLLKDTAYGVERVDLDQVRAVLGPRGCSFDRDVQALVRGRHLLWCLAADGPARPVMRFHHGSRRGRCK